MSLYGIEALRRFREQRPVDPDPPVGENRAQSEGDEKTVGNPGIETEIDDEDDAFESLYEAWIDFGMESGG